MTTYDLAEVRSFTSSLDARMNRCDNGEGMECANIDQAMTQYAKICCEFASALRAWGRAIFSGNAAFDPQVERHWLDEAARLRTRAVATLAHGRKAEDECYVLDGGAALRASLWELEQLLSKWVAPKLSVGPSARQGQPPGGTATEEARLRVASLPPPLPVVSRASTSAPHSPGAIAHRNSL
jgi:hypothetical protein